MKLVDDTLEYECLAQAMQNLMRAESERSKAFEEYEGYSPGYHLRSYVDEVERASAKFRDQLSRLIKKHVEAAMKETKNV